MKMLRAVVVLLLAVGTGPALAAGGPKIPLQEADISLSNTASLQRGARHFVNYCMGCHSAAFSRYNRVANDLGIPEDLAREMLVFTRDAKGEQNKLGALMTNAMRKEDGKAWFGAAPPDLTLVARVRGVDWLYTYLKTFYHDPSRPLGANNLVFENVGMPHVLWELQGWQEKVTEVTVDEHGHEHEESRLVLTEPGELTPVEYDKLVRDLVAFIAYMGEPAQLERKRLGVIVLLFLALFFVVAYYLKKEYWKDVH
jgi:ubiquinol-cytochrome c reductase cytochrome c1 subunit